MFSLMGNCWSSRKRGLRRHLTLAILGLDNAGKTVTTNILQGEALHTAPTIGFQKSDFTFGKYDLTLFDLGGGKKIRGIWTKYLAEVHGVVYLVDSSDTERIEESTAVFKQLLENPKIKGKPVLLLANKQDTAGALDEVDICDHMRLEEIVNANKCPCRVETCTAIKGTGRKKDPGIQEGLQWLCDMISLDFERIGVRVEEDLRIQGEERKRELEERKARVQKLRVEREKAEEEERLRSGEPARPDTPIDEMTNGDPFKRLDYEQLKNKEAAMKAEKKKKKSEETINRNTNKLSETIVTNGLSDGTAVTIGNNINDDYDDDIIIASPSPRHSKLPPLGNLSIQHGEKLERQMLKRVSPNDHHADSTTVITVDHTDTVPNAHAELLSVNKPHIESSVRQPEPLVKPVEKKPEKRRRRKVKKNKLAPLDGGVEDTPRPLDAHTSLPWHNPHTQPARLGTPSLQTTQEHSDLEAGRCNWGMVEDLTEQSLNLNYSNRYGRPNVESDDIMT